MENINEFIKRMDLKQICAFLMNGVENDVADIDNRPYQAKLDEDSKEIFKILQELCNDENTLEKATAALEKALTSHKEVYSEVGIKAGAKFHFQLIKDINN